MSTQAFSEFLEAFVLEDTNFLEYRCERYRVGTERPSIYVLKRRVNSANAISEGNIKGFEVHKQNADGSMSLIQPSHLKAWVVKALNSARAPLIAKQLQRKKQVKHEQHARLVDSGFYQSQTHKDWERRIRSVR